MVSGVKLSNEKPAVIGQVMSSFDITVFQLLYKQLNKTVCAYLVCSTTGTVVWIGKSICNLAYSFSAGLSKLGATTSYISFIIPFVTL